MWVNALSAVAMITIGMSEFCAHKNINRAGWFLVVAAVLLGLAGQLSYLICSTILLFSGALFAAATLLFEKDCHHKRYGVILFLKTSAAGIVHVVGFWIVPLGMVWEWASRKSEGYSGFGLHFFEWEVSHGLWGGALYAALVVLPILLMPSATNHADKCQLLRFQFQEAICYTAGLVGAGIIVVAVPVGISSFHLGHIRLGLLWAGCGVSGAFQAKRGQLTSVHVAIPAITTAYDMICMHSHSYDVRADAAHIAVKKLHILHGVCFGVGGVCRLHRCLHEAIFFFLAGSVFLACSSKGLGVVYSKAVTQTDGDSMDHVSNVIEVVVSIAILILYPLNDFLLNNLRKLLFAEEASQHNSAALPLSENTSEEHVIITTKLLSDT